MLARRELRRRAYATKRENLSNLLAAVSLNGLPADLLPVEVAAVYACCSVTTVRRRIRSGAVTAYYCGQRVLISLGQLVTRSQRPPRSNAQGEAARRALSDISGRRQRRREAGA